MCAVAAGRLHLFRSCLAFRRLLGLLEGAAALAALVEAPHREPCYRLPVRMQGRTVVVWGGGANSGAERSERAVRTGLCAHDPALVKCSALGLFRCRGA